MRHLVLDWKSDDTSDDGVVIRCDEEVIEYPSLHVALLMLRQH